MATLTIRNVPASVVKALKQRAKAGKRSMEQEVRDLLFEHVADRRMVLTAIDELKARQLKPITAEMIDAWIARSRGR